MVLWFCTKKVLLRATFFCENVRKKSALKLFQVSYYKTRDFLVSFRHRVLFPLKVLFMAVFLVKMCFSYTVVKLFL